MTTMATMMSLRPSLLVLVAAIACANAAKRLEFASPLQSLTIPDRDADADPFPTPRSRFLPRFAAGLKAERELRQKIADRRKQALQANAAAGGDSDSWASTSSKADLRRKQAEDRLAAKAFEQAAKRTDESVASAREKALESAMDKGKSNKYQFVGVIDKSKYDRSKSPAITWYARPKPPGSKWSVRLVHVNRKAIAYDLFRRGKVDMACEYKNTGTKNKEDDTKIPVIKADYKIKPRTWSSLWNWSPKHVFTDSSGMFWRERRLRPGLYTDGKDVYETSYRYRDGRNGMHRRSTLNQLLQSKSVDDKTKQRIQNRLASDAPDVVLEE